MESSYSERTAARLARAGALVRVVAEPDACPVCRALSGRAYTPSEVPRLPIRGCMNDVCRCRFEAVDPDTRLPVSELVERGVRALRAGRPELARQILEHVVALDEQNELGWLWLSAVVDDEHKIDCLEKVIALNPENARARAGLAALRQAGVVRRPPEPEPEPAAAPAEPLPDTAVVPEADVEPEAEAPPVAPALSAEVLSELETLRAERRIIVEQWADFVVLAVDLDPEILRVQAQAFLHKIWRMDDQAAEALADGQATPADRLQELYIQWHESEDVGEALAGVIEQHRQEMAGSDGLPVREVLRGLAQQIIDRRNRLREQIAAAGGQVP